MAMAMALSQLWCTRRLLKGMDVPEALQLAAGGPATRSQLLYLLDRCARLCCGMRRLGAHFKRAESALGASVPVPRLVPNRLLWHNAAAAVSQLCWLRASL
jgi:hypothetical protein